MTILIKLFIQEKVVKISRLYEIHENSELFYLENFPMYGIYVTGPEKTGLIYTKYTYSYYGAYLFFCVCYPNSVSFIEFLRILCIYDERCVKILFCHDEILHFKDPNLGQILRVDKTCFLRPGHIYTWK